MRQLSAIRRQPDRTFATCLRVIRSWKESSPFVRREISRQPPAGLGDKIIRLPQYPARARGSLHVEILAGRVKTQRRQRILILESCDLRAVRGPPDADCPVEAAGREIAPVTIQDHVRDLRFMAQLRRLLAILGVEQPCDAIVTQNRDIDSGRIKIDLRRSFRASTLPEQSTRDRPQAHVTVAG